MLVRCGQLTRERVDELYCECDAGALVLPRLAVARDWIAQSEISEIEDLLTRETFFAVLRWTDGSFRFGAREVEHPRRFGELLGAEQILMDGLRCRRGQSFASCRPKTCFPPSGASRLAAEAGPQRCRPRCGGSTVTPAVRQVIDRRGSPAVRSRGRAADRVIARPSGAGVLARAKREPALRRGGPLPLSAGWRRRIAPAASAPGFAIERRPLASARAAHAARASATRSPRSAAPELAALAAGGRAGHAYYYVLRRGAVLLAPER
jgi:hypothetical protein